jgi:hypothetical protein
LDPGFLEKPETSPETDEDRRHSYYEDAKPEEGPEETLPADAAHLALTSLVGLAAIYVDKRTAQFRGRVLREEAIPKEYPEQSAQYLGWRLSERAIDWYVLTALLLQHPPDRFPDELGIRRTPFLS